TKVQFICTAFLRMPRSHYEWCAKSRHFFFQLVHDVCRAPSRGGERRPAHPLVQPQLKQVRPLAHSDGQIQVRLRYDYTHHARASTILGRAARRHYGQVSRRESILSTYLARMSNSRFSKSSALAPSRLVWCFV